MATTTTKKTTTKSTSAKSETVDAQEEYTQTTVNSRIIANEIDMNQLIPVQNGYQGRLIYKSGRTNEEFVWEQFGDEQDMELRELRYAKGSAKSFFENNWFMFPDEYQWVIQYLNVKQFYKNAIDIEHFDDVYKKSPKEIEAALSNLSDGQKRSVAYRASELIRCGEIDSNKAIAALESALGVELIER